MRNTWIGLVMIALAALLLVGSRLFGPSLPPEQHLRAGGAVEPGSTEARATERAASSGTSAVPPASQAQSQAQAQSTDAPSGHPSERQATNPRRATEPPAEVRPAIPGGMGSQAPSGGNGPLSGTLPASPAQPSAPKASPVAPPVTAPAAQVVSSPAPSPAASPAPAKDPAKAADAPGSGTSDDPESDRHPPVLQFLRFDPPEVKDGGTAVLSMGTSDDLSGVKFIYGSVRSPSGAAAVPFTGRDAGSGVFTSPIPIPAHGETGDWYVGNMQIVDKADNGVTLVYARASVPEGGVLRVVSEQSDSTAPVVHRVSVVKASVGAGEHDQVVVELDDDQSGVAAVTGAFQSPSKAAYIAFTCGPNGDGTAWTGDIPVPANADCGEWTLRQLRVVDKANNAAFLSMDSPQVGHVSFTVSGGGQCDSEAPVIDGLYFAPNVVDNANATDVIVTVAAHDDSSGVAALTGWLDGPVAANGQPPRIYFECHLDPKVPDGPLTGHLTIPSLAAKGVWRVTLAQISDKARNTRAYNRDDPALRDAAITVE